MMLLARHFRQPREPWQEPCAGTGMFIDVEEMPGGNQHATCPRCNQSIVLTTTIPSASRGGGWDTP